MTLSREDVYLAGGGWANLSSIHAQTWVCGYCGDKVSSDRGYFAGPQPDGGGGAISFIRICPSCLGPTVFTRGGKHFPGSMPGNDVANVPEKLERLYREARASVAAGAHTGAVLICRKMLMSIAVEQGADEGKRFITYVEFLSNQGYVPPNGKVWVDYIRQRGNEATHEIELMEEEDSVALITFVEMLLRFIYEFPNMVPEPPKVP